MPRACCRPLALLALGEGRQPGDAVGLNQHLSCSQNTTQLLIDTGASACIPQAHPQGNSSATLRLVLVSSRNLLLHPHSSQDASTPLWVLP